MMKVFGEEEKEKEKERDREDAVSLQCWRTKGDI